MVQSRVVPRLVASAAAGLLLLGAGISPAAAMQDPGGPLTTPSRTCSLERIGTQFVWCDYLTGAGVEAPSFVPEQK